MLRSALRSIFKGSSAAKPAAPVAAAPTASSSAATTLGTSQAPSTARAGPVTAADATLEATAPPPHSDSTPQAKPAVRSPTDPASDYQRRLEERFGGQDASALGTLVNGQPEGLAPNVKRNMFRVI
ncbi:hypothetical protein JCM3775_002796 [Rhodotorula graminis]|uniref:Uncharacterized protein n=1 Tax=Rhodotorula graminis (strain WP1) TaxID=578459 RepID=A0A0P9F9S2_RHOGW|nr:uncharacterized protein RHOBADRAFT_46818 [Rhodotorula graminis WP1]KPV72368.1 hypothetical protein RHOBADRAFT_46818 [Rhodotorula graminis WP1]